MTGKENLEKYKQILEKYGHRCSTEQVLEIISNIRDLAQAIINFEEKKNRLKSYANRK